MFDFYYLLVGKISLSMCIAKLATILLKWSTTRKMLRLIKFHHSSTLYVLYIWANKKGNGN